MTVAPEVIEAQIDKFSTNMDRIDRVVNGGVAETVATDDGEVPTLEGAFAAMSLQVKVFETWAELSAITGVDANTGAEIVGDAGTHTDPVTDATVSNTGRFRFIEGVGNGWKRIGDPVGYEYAIRAEEAAEELEGDLALLDDLTTLGEYSETGFSESGYVIAVTDEDDAIAFGVRTDGVTEAQRIECPNIDGLINRATSADNGGSADNKEYVIGTFTNNAGYRQIRVGERNGGRILWSTAGTYHSHSPQITWDGTKVRYISEASGLPVEVSADIETGLNVYPVETLLDVFSFYGDSLTAGTGSSGSGAGQGSFPKQLADLYTGIGRAVTCRNRGVGSMTSTQIAAHQGGAPLHITVSGGSIPASGAVTVSGTTINPGFYNGPNSYTGSLKGVPGTLSTPNFGATYSFTRTTPGSVVAVPTDTPFIFDDAVADNNAIQGLWLGRNGPGTAPTVISFANSDAVLADIALAVANLKALNKRFWVGSVLNSTTEHVNSGDIPDTNVFVKMASVLQSLYPENFIDLRAPPTNDEMTALAFVPDATDLLDIANGAIPTRMRAGGGDQLHLNNIGYALIARRVFTFQQAKGW